MRSMGLTLLGLFLVCVAGVQGQNSAIADSGADAISQGGSASATVSARTTNGEVSAYVKSNAEAYATAENGIASAVATAVTNVAAGGDATAEAYAAADACALAIAEAFASVRIDIDSTGAGSSACADGSAAARAAATAFAQAYSRALAAACDEKKVCGTASANVEVIASGTAEAFAKAYNEGCVSGTGTLSLETVSFAKSITEVYANALASALGEVSSGSATAVAAVDGTTDVVDNNFATTDTGAAVTGDASGIATGGAIAVGGETPACEDAFKFCCNSGSAERSGKCRCPKPRCNLVAVAGQAVLTWEVKSKKINLGNRKSPRYFERGYTCICA